jgi:hypothetical protein
LHEGFWSIFVEIENNNKQMNQFKMTFIDYLNNSEMAISLGQQLKLKGYSPKTRKAYLGYIKRFIDYSDKKGISCVCKIDIYLHI